ncbi:MAG: hypothetical protein K0S00_4836 [Xanthobacteraceae bacterium]|jgi:hypothetical protein|nr:hypothetical protein [Xanthobacteraceae bacterium]
MTGLGPKADWPVLAAAVPIAAIPQPPPKPSIREDANVQKPDVLIASELTRKPIRCANKLIQNARFRDGA